MDATEAQEGIEEGIKSTATRRLALLVAALAALLAIVEVQDDNTAQNALQSNIQASDLWNFFQAKNERQFILQNDIEMLKLQRGSLPADRQAAADAQVKSWQDKIAQYESDPATNEGKQELLRRAQAAEADRDDALAANNWCGYASAALQLGIVLASASIILGVAWLGYCGMGLGVIGLVFAFFAFFAPNLIPT